MCGEVTYTLIHNSLKSQALNPEPYTQKSQIYSPNQKVTTTPLNPAFCEREDQMRTDQLERQGEARLRDDYFRFRV